MTDEQVIKALENLHNRILNDASFLQKVNHEELGALFHICRILEYQEAEIERLTNAYKQCAWERDTFQAEVDGLGEHLSIPNGEEDEDWYTMPQLKTPEETKAEAIKEFVERLKEKSEHFELEKENFVSEEDIDNLVKEMTEQ